VVSPHRDVVELDQSGEPAARISCAHAVRCSGCPLIDLPYAAQLAQKQGRLVTVFASYAELSAVPVERVVGAQERTQYRTRAKLVVAEGPRIGLFAKGGAHVVEDLPACQVLSPALLETAESLRGLMRRPPPGTGRVLVAHERGAPDAGALTAVDLREALGPEGARVLVTLVLDQDRPPSPAELEAAAEAILEAGARVIGVAANFRAPDSPQVLGAKTTVVRGVLTARDETGSVYQLASYGSFVQASREQARRIHALLATEIGAGGTLSGRRVLDLYGGSGAISLDLVGAGARVVLVESFAPAAESAQLAAEQQHLRGLEVRARDVTAALVECARQNERFDAIVMNPPRRGVAPRARTLAARLGAPTLAYVSCNPETLARDLDHFARLGYRARAVRPFDMIPLTDEVETVVLLRRTEPPAPLIVYEDEEIVAVVKAAHETMTRDPDGATSLLDRVRMLSGTSRAVPLSTLDPETSGLVVFARQPEAAASFQRTLAAGGARAVFLAGVRGMTGKKGTINRKGRGGDATSRTRYRMIARILGHSLLRVATDALVCGHALRDCARIGHPVLGDPRQGHLPTNRYFEEKFGLDRVFLHCAQIEIPTPHRGPISVRAPLSDDLRGVLQRMGVPWDEVMTGFAEEGEMAAQPAKN
jgi:23S rRNA (uracil1939-C5)-methyltransferase